MLPGGSDHEVMSKLTTFDDPTRIGPLRYQREPAFSLLEVREQIKPT
jgi:hypothetical protein